MLLELIKDSMIETIEYSEDNNRDYSTNNTRLELAEQLNASSLDVELSEDQFNLTLAEAKEAFDLISPGDVFNIVRIYM